MKEFGRRFTCIRNLLKQKTKESFTGTLKLGFENGDLRTFNEANRVDILTDKIGDITSDSLLQVASERDFNGTIVLVYSAGKITEYAYMRTYKAGELNSLLERNSDAGV